MSIEARFILKATFVDESTAKAATAQLKKSLENNAHELVQSLHRLNPVEKFDDYKDETIHVEQINRSKTSLSISAYSYTSENPVWFARSFYALGAARIFIRGLWDGHGRNFYVLNGELVTKAKFDGPKPAKVASANAAEGALTGRQMVQAQLLSTWAVGDLYESIGMALKTVGGEAFYYQGRGQLVDALYDSAKDAFDTSRIVEFSAEFETAKKDGVPAIFAKRPTKIRVLAS